MSPCPASRRRRAWPVVAAALSAVLAAVALGLKSGADAAPRPRLPRDALRVDVGGTAISRPVPAGFVGLSIEYRSALPYFGSDPAHPDPVFIALMRNLAPGQSPVLRFGGDTTDWTWWPTPAVSKPAGIRYGLSPGWAQSVRATAQALNARLILGINLEADSAPIAGAEARALLGDIGRPYVAGFELGNEPEVYGSLGWYTNAAGRSVPGRPRSYGFSAYLRDEARIASALPGGVPLVGPASGAPRWLAGLHRYLRSNSRIGAVTFHRYPLRRCYTARSDPTFPTIAHLLAPSSSAGLAATVRSAVGVAHASGVPFRVDELNSVSCGGARGVSDRFASALWAVNALFELARVGVDGVNIHTFQKAFYEPFALQQSNGRWMAQVRPLYYGLLLFGQAAPPRSRLLATSIPARSPVQAWATRAPGGTVRVVLINESARRWVTTAVRAPTSAGPATEQRLRAPRLGARSGITFGGQTFGAATPTGQLAGRRVQSTLTPVQHRFVARLAPASATLLTIGGR